MFLAFMGQPSIRTSPHSPPKRKSAFMDNPDELSHKEKPTKP